MPTPLDFASKYREMNVALADGSVKLRIDRYYTGAWDKEGDRVADDGFAYFVKQKTLTLTINGQPVKLTDAEKFRKSLHYAFEGKGSPEDIQVAAQMAVLQKRTTRDNLQTYCDAHMGLDCNGFVGNYLWYGRGNRTWPDDMPGKDDGPNALIDQILFTQTKPVESLDKLQAAHLNVFGLLNNSNRVVPRDGAEHAHITISEPGRFTPTSFVTNSFGGLDPAQQSIYGHPAVWCVESTGPQHAVGLKDAWYALVEARAGKTPTIQSVVGHKGFKVFKVFRGTKHQWANFTIGSIVP